MFTQKGNDIPFKQIQYVKKIESSNHKITQEILDLVGSEVTIKLELPLCQMSPQSIKEAVV